MAKRRRGAHTQKENKVSESCVMAKRRRGARNKCVDQHDSSIDRISMLPDDLLVFILSYLTLKEATSTGILSSRWRYLWTLIPVLDFDGSESLLKVHSAGIRRDTLLNQERLRYCKWVNHVLALHKNGTIKELRVFFDLNKSYKKSISKWIRYALARKVERIELNLTDAVSDRCDDDCYVFPYKLLRTDKPKFSNRLQPAPSSMRQCNSIYFNYLKSISMNNVNVNGEALEFFLCNCPLLEHLSVCGSGELLSLKVSGSSPSLKHLEINSCYNLESFEIRDTNLVYLKYEGSKIHFLLENAPHLVDIHIGGMITDHMYNIFLLLSSCLVQLEKLTIEMYDVVWEEDKDFCSAVRMSNLKQLVVKDYAYKDRSLLPVTSLIRASPCLERFVLKALWCQPRFVKRQLEKVTGSRYTHLKEVEFVGYYGRISDLEVVMHLLENGVALEKIVVDPRPPRKDCLCAREKTKLEIEMETRARTRARRQLTNKVAPRINLTIL